MPKYWISLFKKKKKFCISFQHGNDNTHSHSHTNHIVCNIFTQRMMMILTKYQSNNSGSFLDVMCLPCNPMGNKIKKDDVTHGVNNGFQWQKRQCYETLRVMMDSEEPLTLFGPPSLIRSWGRKGCLDKEAIVNILALLLVTESPWLRVSELMCTSHHDTFALHTYSGCDNVCVLRNVQQALVLPP